jgi:TorA maturation chaperone TorD
MHAALVAGKATPEAYRPDAMDLERAGAYGLLARLVARVPDAALLARLEALPADESPLGQAHAGLARAARDVDPKAVAREHFTLFVGVGRGELLPYASYYLTGFLNERPLAELRGDLAALGYAPAEGVHDPEDHIAILCDVMADLARSGDLAGQRRFFQRHLEPWAGSLFDDIAAAPSAVFYRAVGAFGAAFMTIEARAFAMD